MSDPPDGIEPRRPPTPRWVKVFGAIALVLLVLIILMLAGVFGEGHGPRRHLGGAGPGTPHQNTTIS